jgi:hypothetical protein
VIKQEQLPKFQRIRTISAYVFGTRCSCVKADVFQAVLMLKSLPLNLQFHALPIIVLQKRRHSPQLERPDAVAEPILKFIKDVPAQQQQQEQQQ